ncbi:MAG: carbonic anhydrase [Alphaproteobacteria bacterium]|nr:carbonic anhydrase [Alphaproteobacteria bacterium]
MKDLQKLVTGYKTFISEEDRAHFHKLATEGQFPKVMVIGCSDSRVNPDLIFHARPGDLFVVRNVANLVPPFEVDEASHGTSAALEFAVTGLHVEHIVVMGHSACGGVRACCDSVHNEAENPPGIFIPKWTSILSKCAEDVLHENPDIGIEDMATQVELAGIKSSLNNMKAFPFIQDAMKENKLQIHGAYFDIKEAQLYALDKQTDEFLPVD